MLTSSSRSPNVVKGTSSPSTSFRCRSAVPSAISSPHHSCPIRDIMSFHEDGDTSLGRNSSPFRFNAVVAHLLPSVDSQPCHQFACRMVIHHRAPPDVRYPKSVTRGLRMSSVPDSWIPDYQFGRCRFLLISPRRFFASRRRRCDPLVRLVGRRRRGWTHAFWSTSAILARARRRLAN